MVKFMAGGMCRQGGLMDGIKPNPRYGALATDIVIRIRTVEARITSSARMNGKEWGCGRCNDGRFEQMGLFNWITGRSGVVCTILPVEYTAYFVTYTYIVINHNVVFLSQPFGASILVQPSRPPPESRHKVPTIH